MSKQEEEKTMTLKQLSLVVWILDILRNAKSPGLTFKDIVALWRDYSSEPQPLQRPRFNRHRDYAKMLFGVKIVCPDRMHYRIENPEVLSLDTLANDLLASVHEYLLIDQFRDLGSRLQPAQILSGRQYLIGIANAIRNRKKLAIRYQKFSDSEPYDAVVHPYILKAIMGRWYIAAFKEHSSHADAAAQMFALDRTLSLIVLDEPFEFNDAVNPDTYFNNFFGAYVDDTRYPVRDVTIACDSWVAPYLRTLPLHHSQKEVKDIEFTAPDDWKKAHFFQFHISPSPDFIGTLLQWGSSLVILDK